MISATTAALEESLVQINEIRGEEVGTALVRSLNENDMPEREKGALKNGLLKIIFWR